MWYIYTTRKNEINGTGEHHIKQSYTGSDGQISRSPSNEDYSPETKAVVLLVMGHNTKQRKHMGGIGKGKET
jgi:hypothetical protein